METSLTHLRFAATTDVDILAKRLLVSYVEFARDDPRYISDALAPTPPRHLMPYEGLALNDLIATPETPASSVVELVDHEQHYRALQKMDSLSAIAVQEALADTMPARSEYIDTCYSEGKRRNTSRISADLQHFTPGMADLAGKRPGMHVDNRFHLSLRDRLASPRRLALNLGPGERWLTILLPDIVSIAEDQKVPPTEVPTTKHLAAYIRQRVPRKVKCLWLLQKPYEAYIAPTELLGHDGTTWPSNDPSTLVMYTWYEDIGTYPSVLSGEPAWWQ